jgi:hypothetical protein
MKIKVGFACILIGLVCTISALWLQVRALRASVEQLQHGTLMAPRIQPIVIHTPEFDDATQKRNPFKLIEASNVGVPWSVERAMMGDGDPRRETVQR